MDINKELERIYQDGKNTLVNLPSLKATNPLLLNICEECFDMKKVVLFGQETNDWHGAYNHLKEPFEEMKSYQNFWFDKKSKYSKSGMLMHTFSKIQKEFSQLCFVWNNIIKIGKVGIGTPSQDILQWQNAWFEITKKEIELIDPQLMIFFTGYKYDLFIKKTFGDFEQLKVDNHDVKKFCQLKFEKYPMIIAYRTYHPNYLNRSGLMKIYLPLLLDAIKLVNLNK
jgi:hypothetical protein